MLFPYPIAGLKTEIRTDFPAKPLRNECFPFLKVPVRAPTKLFAFLTPLAIEIWLYMVAGYVLVSITIWIAARVSPKEWREIEPCEECLLKKYGEDGERLSCDGTSGICSDESADEISEIEDFVGGSGRLAHF